MNKSRRVLLNTVAQISGQVVGMLVSLATFIILARYLGSTAYGEYSTIVTYLAFFSVVADWSLYLLIVQRLTVGASPQQEAKAFGEILAFRIVLASASLLLGLLAVILFPYSGVVKLGIVIASVSFLASSVSQLIYAVFQARLKLYLTAALELSYRVLLLAFVYYASRIGLGLTAVMFGMVASSVLIMLIALYVCRKNLRFSFSDIKLNADSAVGIFKSSWGLALSGIFSNLVYRVGILLLSVMAGMTAVGLYSMPSKIIELITILPGAFIGSVFPIINQYYTAKDERLQGAVDRSTLFLMIFAALVACVTYVLAGPIILFIGGSEYEGAISTMRILAFYPLFAFFGNYFYHLAVAAGKQSQIALRTGIMLAISIALGLLLIPSLSINGVAISVLAAEAVGVYLSFRILGDSFMVRIASLKLIGITIASIAAGYLLQISWDSSFAQIEFSSLGRGAQMVALVTALIGLSLTYFLLLMLMRVLSSKDLASLGKKSEG